MQINILTSADGYIFKRKKSYQDDKVNYCTHSGTTSEVQEVIHVEAADHRVLLDNVGRACLQMAANNSLKEDFDKSFPTSGPEALNRWRRVQVNNEIAFSESGGAICVRVR